MRERFEGVEIAVPPSVVLATDVFDAFLEENDLSDFAIRCDDEAELLKRFLVAPGCRDRSRRIFGPTSKP